MAFLDRPEARKAAQQSAHIKDRPGGRIVLYDTEEDLRFGSP